MRPSLDVAGIAEANAVVPVYDVIPQLEDEQTIRGEVDNVVLPQLEDDNAIQDNNKQFWEFVEELADADINDNGISIDEIDENEENVQLEDE